jgi:hypothetical protein
MDFNLKEVNVNVYVRCGLTLSNYIIEDESKEYDASRFELSGLKIACRSARITPKKAGQFVTFWKRNRNGTIEPLHEKDKIDFFAVNVRSENKFGHFIFPRSILIEKGIISTDKREGKRAFRVYPGWDLVQSKQALKTQKWQLNYFFEVDEDMDLHKVKELYSVFL